jgi:Mg2+ and Co2+ transporter CorA
MKWLILFLWFAGAAGLIGAITNIRRFSMGFETTVLYYTPSGRLFVLFVGVICTAAAYFLSKKKKRA